MKTSSEVGRRCRWASAAALLVSVLPALAQRPGTPPPTTGQMRSEGVVLDLNTAAPAELAALPGMGRAYARRIVEGRPYSAKNQLVTRGVIPANAYEQVKDYVVAHRPAKP